MHSRGVAGVAILVAACQWGVCFARTPSQDFLLFAFSAVANISILALMVLINKSYNLLRSMTYLHLGFFALMQAVVVAQSPPYSFFIGSILCLIIAAAVFLLFGSYNNPDNVRTCFCAFLILASGSLLQPSFALFIPLFWIVCRRLRILTLRSFTASLLGVLTPYIIVASAYLIWWGVDGCSLLYESYASYASYALNADRLSLTALLVFPFSFIIPTLLNILKTIAYNAQARAYNTSISFIAIVAILNAFLLSPDPSLALPTLNMCAAYALTHYFVNHRYKRQYLAVLLIFLLYIALFLHPFFL